MRAIAQCCARVYKDIRVVGLDVGITQHSGAGPCTVEDFDPRDPLVDARAAGEGETGVAQGPQVGAGAGMGGWRVIAAQQVRCCGHGCGCGGVDAQHGHITARHRRTCSRHFVVHSDGVDTGRCNGGTQVCIATGNIAGCDVVSQQGGVALLEGQAVVGSDASRQGLTQCHVGGVAVSALGASGVDQFGGSPQENCFCDDQQRLGFHIAYRVAGCIGGCDADGGVGTTERGGWHIQGPGACAEVQRQAIGGGEAGAANSHRKTGRVVLVKGACQGRGYASFHHQRIDKGTSWRRQIHRQVEALRSHAQIARSVKLQGSQGMCALRQAHVQGEGACIGIGIDAAQQFSGVHGAVAVGIVKHQHLGPFVGKAPERQGRAVARDAITRGAGVVGDVQCQWRQRGRSVAVKCHPQDGAGR